MCGICGFVSLREDYKRGTIESMTELLSHRGPDSAGVYLNRVGGGEHSRSFDTGNIALGHRRLSIIDLSESASQPMSNEDGSVWLVFNGEIYNFQSLRAHLVDRGHEFKSRSDGEVILHGYEEWGEEILERLNGMFALAVWDAQRRRMLLARDRLGIKPLYFYENEGRMIFASELTSIRAHPAFDERIDIESLYDYLMLSYVPSPWTIFEGVRKLLPGTYLVWEDGSTRYSRYWEVPLGHDKPLSKEERVESGTALRRNGSGNSKDSIDYYLDELDELLRDSVAGRLISDVPLGAFLSGGVDSSLVVSLMKELSGSEVRTFSIGFNENEFDESAYARRVAEHLKTTHTEFRLDPDITGEMLRKIVSHMDEPIGDPSAIPTFLVSKLARESGITVALSGDGGDELFCGYERYRKMAPIAKAYGLPFTLRRALIPFAKIVSGIAGRRALEELVHAGLADAYFARMGAWKGGAAELSLLLGRASGRGEGHFQKIFERERGRGRELFRTIFERTSALSALDRMMLTDLETYLIDDVLTKVDRMSMAVSLEVRVPILDHRVVEFSRQVPLKYKFDGSELKVLLRRLLKRYVPEEIVDRPKAGFAIPVRKWLLEDMRDEFMDALSFDKIKRETLLDTQLVARAIRRFESQKSGVARFMWGLFVFEQWLEHLGPGRLSRHSGECGRSLKLEKRVKAACS